MRFKTAFLSFLLFILLFLFSCKKNENDVILFHAPAFSPVIDEIKQNKKNYLNFNLINEVSGSQVAIRKVTELGRECDVLISADNILFKEIASSHCSWRIDFANDEVVLGIGIRAKYVDKCEKDWTNVLINNEVILGRVNENLGPIGYRTLLIWKLQEMNGYPNLTEILESKSEKVVDHVSILSALLKSGDVDYGFLYKTSGIKYDIRFIELDKKINLSTSDIDYSRAQITINNNSDEVKIKGAPITYSLSIPDNSPNKQNALKFIEYFLNENKDIFELWGYKVLKPEFYGSKKEYELFKNFSTYKGNL